MSRTFSSLIAKYIDKSQYGRYKMFYKMIDLGNVVKKPLIRYIAAMISHIDYNKLFNFRIDLKELNYGPCTDKSIHLSTEDICNIVDLFIDIDNFQDSVCCNYISVHELIRLCVGNNPMYTDSSVMSGIIEYKFPKIYNISDYDTPEKLWGLWHDNNMPLFDGELMHLTEKPTGPEYVEIVSGLVTRCRNNIDRNITTAEVVKRLKNNGYDNLANGLSKYRDDFIHWMFSAAICLTEPNSVNIISLAMSVDEVIKILSHTKYLNK